MQDWINFIFSEPIDLDERARRVFEYQFRHNKIYRRFCEALNRTPDTLKCHPELVSGSEAKSKKRRETLHQTQYQTNAIPLLPIQAFKDSKVVTTEDNSTFKTQQPVRQPADSKLVFESSGTGGMERSRHYVADAELYRTSLLKGFGHFYDLEKSIIWGYAPGYADNPHSSLIWMINELIRQDSSGLSRFLSPDDPLDPQVVAAVEKTGKQLILFGAAFGLLDLVEASPISLPSNSIVIETGGMKTHRREMSRRELHRRLSGGFGIDTRRIHSEYGMAELLSQAYATGGKWFRTVPWMHVSIRNPDDPMEIQPPHQEGLIGIIDLANVHSCSFILTGDKGIQDKKGRFQVLGRWNPKDLRGCNFLVEED